MTTGLSIGAAIGDITPPLGHGLSGWGESRHGRWMHAPLSCRVLHLSDGRSDAAIVTVDLLGLAATFTDEVRAEIERRVGVPARNVLIAASHTHSGPIVPPWWLPGLDRPDVAYIDGLRNTIVEMVAAAQGEQRPAQVRYGRSRCVLGVNRRLPGTEGKVAYPPRANPAGVVDDEVGVLSFAAPSGQPIAVLFSFGCHPTVGGPSDWIGPDYPGYARQMVEGYFPGAVAAFLLGNCGDVRPHYIHSDARFRWEVPASLVDAAGARVGARVLEALADARPIDDPRLQLGHCERDAWCSDGSFAARCEFTALRIGDVVVASNPAETFSKIGLEVRARADLPVLFASLTNGALGYIPTEDAYPCGGYEVEHSYRGYGLAAPISSAAHGAFRDGMLAAIAESAPIRHARADNGIRS